MEGRIPGGIRRRRGKNHGRRYTPEEEERMRVAAMQAIENSMENISLNQEVKIEAEKTQAEVQAEKAQADVAEARRVLAEFKKAQADLAEARRILSMLKWRLAMMNDAVSQLDKALN